MLEPIAGVNEKRGACRGSFVLEPVAGVNENDGWRRGMVGWGRDMETVMGMVVREGYGHEVYPCRGESFGAGGTVELGGGSSKFLWLRSSVAAAAPRDGRGLR